MPCPSPPPCRQFDDTGLQRHHAYCRKQKSLGLLCSNFVSLYNRDGVDSVGLDDAARRLGVERRRIYDIVNVLESVGVLSRKAKNMYSWIGFSGIPKALEALKEDALRERSGCRGPTRKMVFEEEDHEENVDVNDEDDDEENIVEDKLSQTASSSTSCKTRSENNRKEKSLGLMTQNFVKLFLNTDVVMISLDDAARILLGDINDVSYMRNKVRRLYDIANVLSSVNLIDKIQVEARKPAFRWLGASSEPKADSGVTIAIAPAVSKPTKRAFGNDLTNVDLKRSRNSVVDKKTARVQERSEDLKKCNLMAQKQLGSKSGYVFGPFRPDGLVKGNTKVEEKPGKKVIDWETLASSFRPQYQNQALSDLFAHYVEAWKTWYVEVAQGSSNPWQPYGATPSRNEL